MNRIILGPELHRVADWYARAVNSPISGYLSASPYWAYPTEASGDWDRTIVMSDNGLGLAIVSADRQSSNHTVSVSLWTLGEGWQKRYTAARLFQSALSACAAYGATYLEVAVHASNAASISACTRVMGEPICRRREAAWNSATGVWEDSIMFRTKLSDIQVARVRQ